KLRIARLATIPEQPAHHFSEETQADVINLKRRRGLSRNYSRIWEGPYTIVKKLSGQFLPSQELT
ncbi:hypothetical protein AVEN_107823-1, partial [Araneus ventricosus]